MMCICIYVCIPPYIYIYININITINIDIFIFIFAVWVEKQIEFGPPGLNSDRRAEFSLPRCPLLQPLSARCVTGPAVHSGDCDSWQFAAVTAEWKTARASSRPPSLHPLYWLSGRAALTSHQATPDCVWTVGESR